MGIKVTAADEHFSMAVRAAAHFMCEHCGVAGKIPNSAPMPYMPREGHKLECAHLIGRRNASTRWDMLNAVCLCHTCHREFTEEPHLFNQWVESEYGKGRWPILYEKKRAIIKNNAATRKEVSEHYRNQLSRLNETGWITSWI